MKSNNKIASEIIEVSPLSNEQRVEENLRSILIRENTED